MLKVPARLSLKRRSALVCRIHGLNLTEAKEMTDTGLFQHCELQVFDVFLSPLSVEAAVEGLSLIHI